MSRGSDEVTVHITPCSPILRTGKCRCGRPILEQIVLWRVGVERDEKPGSFLHPHPGHLPEPV